MKYFGSGAKGKKVGAHVYCLKTRIAMILYNIAFDYLSGCLRAWSSECLGGSDSPSAAIMCSCCQSSAMDEEEEEGEEEDVTSGVHHQNKRRRREHDTNVERKEHEEGGRGKKYVRVNID